MTNFENIKGNAVQGILSLAFILLLSVSAFSQSPKKYLKNGFHEQAFVEAVHKQNKKVKLKKKFVEVINVSYKDIYTKHCAIISSTETDWLTSYNRFIRMTNFRARVTHPGVYDNLENILLDSEILDQLAVKFNKTNLSDIKVAESFESVNKHKKALELYEAVAKRNEQVKPFTTLKDRLIIIDCEAKLERANQKIGDQYISEAKELLEKGTTLEARRAIELIEEARTYRPLDSEEEELLTLADLIIGESWIMEANKLLETKTKKNARLAFELINKARTKRTLSAEEERLLELAENLGTTRILVSVKGGKPVNDSESISGFLNKNKSSQWLSYYSEAMDDERIDFEMEIGENQPKVVLGDMRKQVKQNTKTVEYWEEVTDANGNVTKVKKTRLAVAMVTIVSRTKTASLDWSILLKDPSDGKPVHSSSKQTIHEITNEFVSLKSGDILALPEDIESDIALDSQPFPEDKAMLNQVKDQYLHELNKLVKASKDHMRNVNVVIED